MSPTHYDSTDSPYRVLVPVSDNERSALAQARFVASLPGATSVEATLTHVLHGEELGVARELHTAQRVGAVVHAADYLRDGGVNVRIADVDNSRPPHKGIVALADELDVDLIVLGGGIHTPLQNLRGGRVVQAVGRSTKRPITVVGDTSTRAY